MKVENKPNGIYVRNYIEKGKLLEQLTEYKRGSWDNLEKISTDDLDQITQEPRMTGPGARAARQKQEPDFDPSVTGRAKR